MMITIFKTMVIRNFLTAAATALMLAFAACSSSDKTVNVTGIEFSGTTITFPINEEKALVPTILPTNATNKSVRWLSNNENIASVSNSGLVTGRNPGMATITATTVDGSYAASCEVTVTSIVLNKAKTTLVQGSGETLIPTILPANATDKAITWSSNNENIASVSNSGLVTGRGLGTATITATTVAGAHADCNVTVNLSMNKADYILIPAGFNAFVRETDIHANEVNRSAISETCVQLVNNRVIDIYFRCNRTGNIKLALDMQNRNTNYQMRATASVRNSSDDGWDTKDFSVITMASNTTNAQFIPIAEFYNNVSGYIRVSLQPMSTVAASSLPEIYNLGVSSDGLLPIHLNYGRQLSSTPPGIGQMRNGTNIHLGYTFDSSWGNIEYFYNELTVEEGFDVNSTFFMANGGQGGYFGMQVNGQINGRTERRMLFSIWTTFDTQNPSQIPVEYSVQILKEGEEVTMGEFGNEGSGRQCYINAMWKTGLTYKFLKRS
jgi:hypothetical protein